VPSGFDLWPISHSALHHLRLHRADQITTAAGDGEVIFIVRLTPLPGVDPIRALRRMLKVLKRFYGMRCLSVQEEVPAEQGSRWMDSSNS
jgi:hypothetical protein